MAHAIPGLPQYWRPVLMDAEARGSGCLGGAQFELSAASAYVEKNWGRRFPAYWWWGQAAFAEADASVAFSGGRMRLLGEMAAATAMNVRLGERELCLAPPLARARVAATSSAWRVEASRPGWIVRLEGDQRGAPVTLPVPEPTTRSVAPRATQHLAARLSIVVWRRGRRVLEAESLLAGLERGAPE